MWGNYKTGESHVGWVVVFRNISVTQDELGWQPDDQTRLGTEPYTLISVTIDGVTGALVSRYADDPTVFGMAQPSINSHLDWLTSRCAIVLEAAAVALFSVGFMFVLRSRKKQAAQNLP
jgi:hypothetical protein